jgi:hypothetical protein
MKFNSLRIAIFLVFKELNLKGSNLTQLTLINSLTEGWTLFATHPKILIEYIPDLSEKLDSHLFYLTKFLKHPKLVKALADSKKVILLGDEAKIEMTGGFETKTLTPLYFKFTLLPLNFHERLKLLDTHFEDD